MFGGLDPCGGAVGTGPPCCVMTGDLEGEDDTVDGDTCDALFVGEKVDVDDTGSEAPIGTGGLCDPMETGPPAGDPMGTGPLAPDPTGTAVVTGDPMGTGVVTGDPMGTGPLAGVPTGTGALAGSPVGDIVGDPGIIGAFDAAMVKALVGGTVGVPEGLALATGAFVGFNIIFIFPRVRKKVSILP